MPVTITVTTNGPYAIAADDVAKVTIIDARAQSVTPVADGSILELCRCGQSQSKPFCDGTHATIGFTDGV